MVEEPIRRTPEGSKLTSVPDRVKPVPPTVRIVSIFETVAGIDGRAMPPIEAASEGNWKNVFVPIITIPDEAKETGVPVTLAEDEEKVFEPMIITPDEASETGGPVVSVGDKEKVSVPMIITSGEAIETGVPVTLADDMEKVFVPMIITPDEASETGAEASDGDKEKVSVPMIITPDEGSETGVPEMITASEGDNE